MSNSPSLRSSSFGDMPTPSTPDSTPSAASRGSYFSVAPKSEYLKNAIHARRAQPSPSLPPQDSIPKSSSPAPSSAQQKDARVSPDIFLQYALSEEQTAPVSPVQRKRPSDFGYATSKTNRELSKEIERLKESLMTANLRVELLSRHKRESQAKLASALETIERLEPVEDEVHDLRAENKKLKLRVNSMKEEMARLNKVNEEHRKINEELTTIASESAAHWSAHESAIDEAAECIIKMEEEKAALSQELQELKERVAAIERVSSETPLAAGLDKYPSRVYSVDESRPSTSHFDSDYYSQPDSPQPKPSRESVNSLVPSERSKKFLDLSEQHRRSARDLVKRMSAASLRALCDATPCPSYQQHIATVEEEEDRSPTPRKTSVQRRRGYEAASPALMPAAEIGLSRPHTVAPYAETTSHPDGLRGLYHPDRSRNRRANNLRSASGQFESPTNIHRLSTRPQTTYETRQRPGFADSEVDLTSVVDPLEDKERWWRSMDRLTIEQVIARYTTLE
ncbi:hypothetical protein COCVIDRAFT_12397 [Bipolaris victoriae FI3]|uniref:Uncharacterized protein n=1 Tax=Bipolaris victoriae (strain FI3) TaxID=930091 RepID=W7F636_BIPV3|nr:hypothetical protein COCVIDRAFT_12397 [Bipolaris victoriae FI3]